MRVQSKQSQEYFDYAIEEVRASCNKTVRSICLIRTGQLQPRISPWNKKEFSIFLYVQVLDVLTTLIGFKTGAAEASPAVRWMIQSLSPVGGLATSKVAAIALAGICIWINKPHVIRRINYWYAGLVVWNLAVILAAK